MPQMTDQFPDATKMPPEPPSRAALAAVLTQAAEPDSALLADRPVPLDDFATQRIDMANGWSLFIDWEPGSVMATLPLARSPEGAEWSHGCDRWPDWNAGPEAVVLNPLAHLITPEVRGRLRQRLQACCCWPELDPLPVPPPPTREQLDALWSVEEMAS